MKKKFNLFGLLAVSLLVAAHAPAQRRIDNRGKCSGPVYNARDVTRRARILQQPDFKAIYEAFGQDVHARVSLEAVLCRSGQVTDIRVIESAPPNVGEFVAAAVTLMRFAPAEMNWHTVSQRQGFEFSINGDSNIEKIDSAATVGRLVESVDIVGNRRMTAEQIRSWVKTRPGDPYNFDQVTRDSNALLATGYFDKLRSRVTTEDGVRGGIGVAFVVVELPLISEVKFEGLRVDQATINNALVEAHIDLRTGAAFDSAQMKLAIRVIKELLASRGFPNAKVALQIESVTANTLSLTFVISDE